jgi:hypothetical protein
MVLNGRGTGSLGTGIGDAGYDLTAEQTVCPAEGSPANGQTPLAASATRLQCQALRNEEWPVSKGDIA